MVSLPSLSSEPPPSQSPSSSLWPCSSVLSYLLSTCQKPYKGQTPEPAPQGLQPQPQHRTSLCGEAPEFGTYELRLERGIDCDPVFFSSDHYDQHYIHHQSSALILIGNLGAARNTFYLKKVGVTHVLNTAEGSRMGTVDTNQNYYKPFGIKYKGLKLLDVAQTNISMYFNEVADFIDDAVRSGGQVLVNCLMGMSRSSTCVIAYLMLKQNMTAVQALTEVRRHRDVRPNDGFLRQLADLDNKLRRERGQLMG
ncbi:dual specificity protein phosphatase 3-like isoform X2 [Tigriopus californicus]|uniref:dual specificity protein phosphatase 3-like isoform X2 n=1 Tax=Tigriopus californicus TaxID=6832 RepID=UPI0027DA7FB8|nr:dual specificity protein phosphatase 3-like isoform X2 [Tigriopus californicus]